jgi:hypothetical protein
MAMQRSTRLQLICLERRDVPAQFGVPWPDHHVTLSFVPDGTSVDGVASNLSAYFAAANISYSVWTNAVLSAVQQWSSAADLSVGLVDDDGSAIGTAGRTQHDLRFGDIRVCGRPLASDVVSVTVPPGPATGTRGGDITINTAQPINIGGGVGKYDLYTCMLQETGHALGLSNDPDINSPMYEWYQGVRSGITSNDANHIVSLYGPRTGDLFDKVIDNGVVVNATNLDVPPTLAANAPSIVEAVADISSPNDVDYYSFTVPTNSAGTIAVRLQTAGLSLLKGRLTVLSFQQEVIMDCQMSDSQSGNLVDSVANVLPGESYYIRVARAQGPNDFGVGQYRLQIDFNPFVLVSSDGSDGSTDAWVFDDDHTNDSIASAQVLADDPARPGEFGIDAHFGYTGDVDVYKISVPSSAGSAPLLTVSIRSATTGMSPLLSVVDAQSVPVPYQVLRNVGGLYTLQATVAAGQDIYLVAKANPYRAAVIGDYRLDANLNTSATPLTDLATGTLTQSNPVIVQTLVVNCSNVMHFVLMENASNPSNDFGAQTEVVDSNGVTVLKFGAASYTSASASKFLPRGTYTIRVGGKVRTPGATLPTFDVSLRVFNLSDPIGPRSDNPDLPDDYWRGQPPVTWDPWDIDIDIIF